MVRFDTGWRAVVRVWFVPDGSGLAVRGLGAPPQVWTFADPGRREELHHPAIDFGTEWSPDLSLVAVPLGELDLQFGVTGVQLYRGSNWVWTDDNLSLGTLTLTFSPTGSRLWGVGARFHSRHFDYSVLAWDTADGQRLLTVGAPTSIDWIVPSPDGRLAVARTGSADGICFLNVFDESWRRTVSQPIRIHSLAWCPDSHIVAVGTSEGVALIDALTAQLVTRAQGPHQPAAAVAVHPQRPFFLSGGDEAVRLWAYDEHSLTQRESFDWQIGRVATLAISPDGMLAAAGSADGHIVVWDLAD